MTKEDRKHHNISLWIITFCDLLCEMFSPVYEDITAKFIIGWSITYLFC